MALLHLEYNREVEQGVLGLLNSFAHREILTSVIRIRGILATERAVLIIIREQAHLIPGVFGAVMAEDHLRIKPASGMEMQL